MTEDWLIDCCLCITQDVGQSSHTCCEIPHCWNLWLDRKRQGIRNGDLGHKNGRTRPSRRETNNETWDFRFSRTYKLAVVSNMTTCSFLRPLPVCSGETNASIFRKDEGTCEFFRNSVNHIWNHTEPHYEYVANMADRCLVLNWTHRELSKKTHTHIYIYIYIYKMLYIFF